jgi:HSP20 family protein
MDGDEDRGRETTVAGLLLKREEGAAEHRDPADRLERMIDEWAHLLPVRMLEPLRSAALLEREVDAGGFLRVDEYTEGKDLVVRVEVPGVDVEKDVDITLSDHHLHIAAERHETEESEERGFRRRELHYGRFARDVMLPEGVTSSDVSATYENGILEIRVHLPEDVPAARIPITTT